MDDCRLIRALVVLLPRISYQQAQALLYLYTQTEPITRSKLFPNTLYSNTSALYAGLCRLRNIGVVEYRVRRGWVITDAGRVVVERARKNWKLLGNFQNWVQYAIWCALREPLRVDDLCARIPNMTQRAVRAHVYAMHKLGLVVWERRYWKRGRL